MTLLPVVSNHKGTSNRSSYEFCTRHVFCCFYNCFVSHTQINEFDKNSENNVTIIKTRWNILLESGKTTVYPTVFALLCFVVVVHWLIIPNPSGLLHWHCGNLTIAPVPAKQPWWIWINTSREFIMNDCITTTKQSTTKPCAYFLGYTVHLCVMRVLQYCVENKALFETWN